MVREGNHRATSVHRTQAEAAEAAREVARKDGAAFLLHARDGRVRDRRDYGGGGPGSPGDKAEGPTPDAGGAVGNAAGAAARTAGGVVGLASGVAGGVIEGIGAAAVGGRDGGEGSGTTLEETGTHDAEEAGGLAYEERYAGYEVYDRGGERLG